MPLALVASWPGYHDEMGLVVGLVSHGQLQWIRMNSVYGSTCHEGNGKSLPQSKRQIHKVFNSIRPHSSMTSGLTKSKGGQGLPRASTASASNAVDVVLWSKFSLTPGWIIPPSNDLRSLDILGLSLEGKGCDISSKRRHHPHLRVVGWIKVNDQSLGPTSELELWDPKFSPFQKGSQWSTVIIIQISPSKLGCINICMHGWIDGWFSSNVMQGSAVQCRVMSCIYIYIHICRNGTKGIQSNATCSCLHSILYKNNYKHIFVLC